MKKYTIVLFALLCIFVYCSGDDEENYDDDTRSECVKKTSASKAKDCNKLKVGDGLQYCCYAEFSSDEVDSYKGCTEITKEAYNKIKDYISEIEKEGKDINIKIKKLDCNSAHLEIGLLSLLLILF